MSTTALYTFGLLDPAAGPGAMADFGRRGAEVFADGDEAPGFLGRASGDLDGTAVQVPGQDFGRWGSYALPLGLPDFTVTTRACTSRR